MGNDASAELNDKVKELADEQIQEMEEGADVDSIYNNAFVKVVGENSGFCRGQGVGVQSASRRTMQGLQEQLQTQQKEVEEERGKRETVECRLIEVQNKIEEQQNKIQEQQKNREALEARIEQQQKKLKHQQKILKEGMLALASHLLTSQNGLTSAILNLITDTSLDDANPETLVDDIMDDHV